MYLVRKLSHSADNIWLSQSRVMWWVHFTFLPHNWGKIIDDINKKTEKIAPRLFLRWPLKLCILLASHFGSCHVTDKSQSCASDPSSSRWSMCWNISSACLKMAGGERRGEGWIIHRGLMRKEEQHYWGEAEHCKGKSLFGYPDHLNGIKILGWRIHHWGW